MQNRFFYKLLNYYSPRFASVINVGERPVYKYTLKNIIKERIRNLY